MSDMAVKSMSCRFKDLTFFELPLKSWDRVTLAAWIKGETLAWSVESGAGNRTIATAIHALA